MARPMSFRRGALLSGNGVPCWRRRPMHQARWPPPHDSTVRCRGMSIVRPAEPQDADAAIDVVRRSITQLCVADHHHHGETLAIWLENKTRGNFLAWISNVDNFCVVAESNLRLSGVAVLQRQGEILLFYLAPGAQ